jgi:CheY-like chemotaxis protein
VSYTPGVARSWDRPDEHDHLLVIADDDPLHLQLLCERVAVVKGRERTATLGRYPRFEIQTAANGDEALRRVTARVTVLAVDLVMPRRNGIEVIQAIRPKRKDLAILAFTAAAPAADAVAAVRAGADHFHQYGDGREGEFENALEQAIDRRRLVRLIEAREEEAAEARTSLAALGAGDLGLPGLRPPTSREAVVPFEQAAARYLQAAAELFDGDPKGLAQRLGLSYFALRRLLRRHGVAFPGRSRGKVTR